jgi:hypothetical protein
MATHHSTEFTNMATVIVAFIAAVVAVLGWFIGSYERIERSGFHP